MFENFKEILPNLLSYGTIAAVFGFLAKSLYDLLIQRRKENLKYVNNQIEKLSAKVDTLTNTIQDLKKHD